MVDAFRLRPPGADADGVLDLNALIRDVVSLPRPANCDTRLDLDGGCRPSPPTPDACAR